MKNKISRQKQSTRKGRYFIYAEAEFYASRRSCSGIGHLQIPRLISTLFARYFKAIDSYNRLNVTNANLYRANGRLEKINDKLTEENTRLKAENKDYSLLRKVFGHKQIDDLLERARNIKGRKHDDSRSR